MRTLSSLLCAAWMVLALQSAIAGDGGIDRVAVIAHSVSTAALAREVRAKAKWAEVTPREARYILVVCRSQIFTPLNATYRSLKDLDADAALQLNIVGSYYHIYLFRINDDLTMTQAAHRSFRAGN